MTRTHRKSADERLYAAAQDASFEGAPQPSGEAKDLERRMKELFVGFDGVQYVYDGFRYDRLSDAMAYATLMRSRPPESNTSTTRAAPRNYSLPTEAERALMATLGIELVDHTFRFKGFRYDRLSDAVAYASQSGAVVDRSDSR